MKNDLILITCEYPYLKEETFLESEINIISNFFDNIYIFSTNVMTKDLQTRHVPENVFCYQLSSPNSRRLFALFNGLFFKKEIGLKIDGKTLIEKIYSIYFRGRAYIIYKRMKNILENKIVFKNKIVIYSYWLTYNAIVALKIKDYLLSKKNEVLKVVSRAHRYDIYDYTNKLHYMPYQHFIIKSLNSVNPCSDDGTLYLRKKHFLHNIYTERLGVYPSSNNNVIKNFDEIFKKIGFITVSHLDSNKRVELFALAFAMLYQKYKNVYWDCVGEGKNYKKIKKIIIKNYISNRVTMHGHISNSEVLNLYSKNQFSFFINVSTSEGVPVSIMEAQANGIPVIATNVGGSSEIVNNKNGILLSKDINPELLCKVISEEIEKGVENWKNKRQQTIIDFKKNSNACILYKKWAEYLNE